MTTSERVLTRKVSHEVTGKVTEDFGVVDGQGRTIGARVTLFEETFEVAPAGATHGSIVPPGHYFSWQGGALRGGERYGAGTVRFRSVKIRQL